MTTFQRLDAIPVLIVSSESALRLPPPRIVFSLNTSADHFAHWLEDYTQVAWLQSFPTEKGRIVLQKVREERNIGGSYYVNRSNSVQNRRLVIDSFYMHAVAPDTEQIHEAGYALSFGLQPLATERVQLTIHCLQPVIQAYFENLLQDIARAWPEAEQVIERYLRTLYRMDGLLEVEETWQVDPSTWQIIDPDTGKPSRITVGEALDYLEQKEGWVRPDEAEPIPGRMSFDELRAHWKYVEDHRDQIFADEVQRRLETGSTRSDLTSVVRKTAGRSSVGRKEGWRKLGDHSLKQLTEHYCAMRRTTAWRKKKPSLPDFVDYISHRIKRPIGRHALRTRLTDLGTDWPRFVDSCEELL